CRRDLHSFPTRRSSDLAAPAALAVRTPPVVVPMLVAVIVTLTAWSVLFGVRTIRHGLRLPLTIVDLLLTGGACLLMPWLVAPERSEEHTSELQSRENLV